MAEAITNLAEWVLFDLVEDSSLVTRANDMLQLFVTCLRRLNPFISAVVWY